MAQILVHGLNVARKSLLHQFPQKGVRTVVGVQVSDNIMYLDVVAELDCALVVDAEDGIIIIEDEKPLAATIVSKELVLCSLVNHSENQGYQIVEN